MPMAAAGDGALAVMRIFIASGFVFLAIGLPAAGLLRNPPAKWHCSGVAGPGRSTRAIRPAASFACRSSIFCGLRLFANVIAGITIISNAVVILSDLTRLAPAKIAPLFGVVSLFNALGRFFWGGISDRIGCQRTFAAMFAVQAATLYWLCGVHTPAPAFVGFAIVLLCCGGGFGTMPSYSAQCFGTRYMGLNYGLVLTAWGVAGLLGPVLVARAKDFGVSFAVLMPAIACALLASVILPMFTRRPPLAGCSVPAV